MDDLQRLENWLTPLVSALEPAQRRALSRELATELRRRQSKRIAAQLNPDGSRYVPRKRQPKSRMAAERARIGAMFVKLRTARFLKTEATTNVASVQILGRAARIASVHQWGLFDRPEPGGPLIQYRRRELLGFSEDDIAAVQDITLRHLGV